MSERTCHSCGNRFTLDIAREAKIQGRLALEGRLYKQPNTCTPCRLARQLARLGADSYRITTCVSCGDEAVIHRTVPDTRAKCGDCRHQEG